MDAATAMPVLAGYRIEKAISSGNSFLAVGPGQKRVVLKPLDPDCLLRGQLHPMVHDRLARVRELAHLGVAHLYTVERDGDRAFLVWQWVEGTPLEQFLRDPPQGRYALPVLARDLVLSVESLHALGIVHGAIHLDNIIVTPSGGICLTHISPLLFTDFEVDLDALRPILEEMGCAPVLHNLPGGKTALRELVIRLVSFAKGEVAGRGRTAAVSVDEGRRSVLALIGAAVAAGIGLGVALVFWRRAKDVLWQRPRSTPGTPEGGNGP